MRSTEGATWIAVHMWAVTATAAHQATESYVRNCGAIWQ